MLIHMHEWLCVITMPLHRAYLCFKEIPIDNAKYIVYTAVSTGTIIIYIAVMCNFYGVHKNTIVYMNEQPLYNHNHIHVHACACTCPCTHTHTCMHMHARTLLLFTPCLVLNNSHYLVRLLTFWGD